MYIWYVGKHRDLLTTSNLLLIYSCNLQEKDGHGASRYSEGKHGTSIMARLHYHTLLL